MTSSVETLVQLTPLLDEIRALVETRVEQPAPPDWAEERGWVSFLTHLPTDRVRLAEQRGLPAITGADPRCPPSLARLAACIAEVTRTAADLAAEMPISKPAHALPRASERKRGQVAVLVDTCRRLGVEPLRVVDVGAGHGHLTRELGLALGVPVVGLERDPALATTATRLGTSDVRVTDVHEDVALTRDDLVVGLHACGDLGDALVTSAANAGAHAVLVSCCFQKIRGPIREPISRAGARAGVRWERTHLGLANLSVGAPPVEASVERSIAGRRTRYALRLLLEGRGVSLRAGDESRGINRRRMLEGLSAVAPVALEARGLAPASMHELAEIEARTEREHALIRRFSLPRVMVGRVLELAIVLDRAAHLEEAGHRVTVGPLFPSRLSPRNLGIVATNDGK
jgi:hypothetical protein